MRISNRRVGYSLIRDEEQDLRDQSARLRRLQVRDRDMHWDLVRENPPGLHTGLRAALESCTPGDLLVVPALDRLAISLEDLEDMSPHLIEREIRLDIGGVVFEPFNDNGQSVCDSYLLALSSEAETSLRSDRNSPVLSAGLTSS
ncbi:recombinase family protein [Streptomyces sp. AK02-01A]|uniref:recombinase family protein n=1 Tax=Streptomyces sp. AK02-01A TaxID=3028648 RepID=UPI0029BF58C6|nr:recombinase family protein [Streptomyces sp. AK02-01A]MDX3855347.1 recombinase family protein [Streptomyces sp. AK02-01A]